MAKVILTGATGFVGKALSESLIESGHEVIALVRSISTILRPSIKQIQFDLNKMNDLNFKLFANDAIVIHAAARAHVMHDSSNDPLFGYRKINRDATLELAQIASRGGAKRFIYISSIKVNGEFTQDDSVFSPYDVNIPNDPYGLSKYEAEQSLFKLASVTRMEVVVIRPPLVYGIGVKANFSLIMNLVKKQVPLPFGRVENKRSMLALDNLVNFLIFCVDVEKTQKAVNQVFLLSDGEVVSTSTLLRRIAKAYGVKSRLLPVPVFIMQIFAKLLGKSDVANRLFGDLQVDSSKASELLGWNPVVTMDEQLRKMAEFEKTTGKL